MSDAKQLRRSTRLHRSTTIVDPTMPDPSPAQLDNNELNKLDQLIEHAKLAAATDSLRARVARALSAAQAEEGDQRVEASGDQNVSDIPSNDDNEGDSVSEASSESDMDEGEGLLDSTGEASGRRDSPPHRPVVPPEVSDAFADVLRLRVRETRELCRDAFWIRCSQLSKEGGYYADLVWNSARSRFDSKEQGDGEQWKTEGVGFELGGSPVAIGIFPMVPSDPTPWLCVAEPTKAGSVQFLVLRYESERIEEQVARAPRVQRGVLSYSNPHRVVLVEYTVQESFQTEAALLAWASQYPQDVVATHLDALLQYVRTANSRGLLRPLFGPRAGALLYRRIQGQQTDDSDMEPIPSRRSSNDAKKKVLRRTKEDQPSGDVYSQRSTGGNLLQLTPKKSILSGTLSGETSDSGSDGDDRPSRLRRSPCQSNACYHTGSADELSSEPRVRPGNGKLIRVSNLMTSLSARRDLGCKSTHDLIGSDRGSLENSTPKLPSLM